MKKIIRDKIFGFAVLFGLAFILRGYEEEFI
jgi:hypothetical protein